VIAKRTQASVKRREAE
jgi:hypothetical protein